MENTVSGREKWSERGVGLLLTETVQESDIVIFSEVSRITRSILQVLEMLECCVLRGINA
ncbi:MAG: hypothetical protein V7K48_03285 [Nostoc sp.]|uniref:recombinase family protein n=1 Tax=Nostoc sp. TaxID=1180 RepID=UPI002FF6F5F8